MADEQEVAAAYDEALEAYREAPTEENRARRDELAAELQAARQASRQARETEALALSDGDGVARPAPVEGTSGVNQ